MKKRIISWIVTGVMLVTLFPCNMEAKAETPADIKLSNESIEYFYLQPKGDSSKSGYMEYQWVDETGEIAAEMHISQQDL